MNIQNILIIGLKINFLNKRIYMIIYKKKKKRIHLNQTEYENYEKFVSTILKNRHGIPIVKSSKEASTIDIDYIRSMLKWDNKNSLNFLNEIINYKFEHFKNSKDVILIIKYYKTKKIINDKFHHDMMKNYK